MARSTLKKGEFAVKTRTAFTLEPTGPVIKVSSKGILSITLNYISNQSQIQVNTGPDPVDIDDNIGDSGIFDRNTALHFDDLSSLPAIFKLAYDAGNDIIWLEADKISFNLITDAEKGRQGDTFMNKQEKNLKAEDQSY
ncbi:MAG: hypothetical protein ABI113_07660 [Mucilaginibacter sp.]